MTTLATRAPLLIALCALVALALGCQNKQEAEKQCNRFTEVVCKQRIKCGPKADGVPEITVKQCQEQLAVDLDCSKAVGWNADNIEACLEDFGGMTCEQLRDRKTKDKLPSSCENVILLGDE